MYGQLINDIIIFDLNKKSIRKRVHFNELWYSHVSISYFQANFNPTRNTHYTIWKLFNNSF